MKKYILSMIFAVGFGMNLCAQIGQNNSNRSDGFFSSSGYTEYREDVVWEGNMPLLPSTHGYLSDFSAAPEEQAPIGSGLLLLAGMGLGYAIKKKKNS